MFKLHNIFKYFHCCGFVFVYHYRKYLPYMKSNINTPFSYLILILFKMVCKYLLFQILLKRRRRKKKKKLMCVLFDLLAFFFLKKGIFFFSIFCTFFILSI